MKMQNETLAIRTARKSGPSAVAKILTPYSVFSHKGGDCEYTLEAKMIVNLMREICKTFHADIAKKISRGFKVSEKQIFAVAAEFCEISFTFGDFRNANSHLF